MLADDNPLADPQLYSQADADLSEFIHTDLFLNSTSASSSRASSPQSPFQSLLTPPQSAPMTSFPDVYESPSAPSSSGLFNMLLDDDLKLEEPQPADTYDFFGTVRNSGVAMDVEPQASMGIDPQLVGTPSSHDSPAPTEEEEEVIEPAPAPGPLPLQEQSQEKLNVTIAPIKVGGHGKSRKGTVQNGGVAKKTATAPPPPPAPVQIVTAPSPAQDKDIDDDDLPADWRPPPEVFAKMTSKEKRQLRNKISARNFRVRRKGKLNQLLQSSLR